MNISVSIDFMQLKRAVTQCDVNEKLELLRLLENETFPNRFKKLLEQIKTDSLDSPYLFKKRYVFSKNILF